MRSNASANFTVSSWATDQCREESRNAEADWRDGEEAKRNPNYSARKSKWSGHSLFQYIQLMLIETNLNNIKI